MLKIFKFIFAMALLAGISYGGWQYFKPKEGAAPAPSVPVPVSAAAVMLKDVPKLIKVVGTVMPYQTVGIRSRLDSQVMDVGFHDGDTVKKGAMLFTLDDRTLKAQMVQTEANLQRDKAQMENLQRQYERVLKLSKQGYSSRTDLDNAKAALDVASATTGADRAALENTQVQLGYTSITAPIDGRTGTIQVTKGNTVKANDTQPMVTINQVQPILVQAALPQSNFDAVRQAMQAGTLPVSALRDGGGAAAEGTLEYIDNAIDQGTGTFATRAVFTNADERLWPGMLVTLAIRLGEDKQALVVPEVAVQHGQSGDYVFVVAGGKAQKRNIHLSRMENNQAVVADGLQENEQVAVDGLMSLKDGSAVTVQKLP